MFTVKKIMVFATLLGAALISRAGEPMTLRECMEHAVDNSTRMKIARADRSDEQVARRDAILSAFLPRIGAGISGGGNFGRAIDPETNVYMNTTSISNGYSVSGSITLFNGFSAVNSIRINNTLLKMGVSQDRIVLDQTCLAVMEAFYNVLYYTKMLSFIEEQVNAAAQSLRKVEIQERNGQQGYADVVQAKANLSSREQVAVTTRNQLDNAVLTLKDLMFWPAGEPLEIDTSSVEKDAVIAPYGGSAAAITEFVLANNPEMTVARGRVENAGRELMSARWRFAPSISMSGGWSTGFYAYPGRAGVTTLPFSQQFNNNMGEYLSLSVSIPVFNNLTLLSNVRRKKNALARASAELDQKARDIENAVARAVNDRDAAEAAYYSADHNMELQKEAFSLNSRKFDQGMISSIEYQTASGNYLEAEAARLNALLQYYIKSAVVRNYNGESYIEQNL